LGHQLRQRRHQGKEIVMRDQPNSCSSGTISIPGVDRTAAPTISAMNVTAETIHA